MLDVVAVDRSYSEFVAENSAWKLGCLVMSRVSAPPVRVVRTKTQVRRDPVDHWVVKRALLVVAGRRIGK